MTDRPSPLDGLSDADRKRVILAALFDYFPDALVECALVIADGQRQHKTDDWDKTKSTDHANCLLRHFLQRGTTDTDGRKHSGKVAVRALMALQIEFDHERGGCPVGPGCSVCKVQARTGASRRQGTTPRPKRKRPSSPR